MAGIEKFEIAVPVTIGALEELELAVGDACVILRIVWFSIVDSPLLLAIDETEICGGGGGGLEIYQEASAKSMTR